MQRSFGIVFLTVSVFGRFINADVDDYPVVIPGGQQSGQHVAIHSAEHPSGEHHYGNGPQHLEPREGQWTGPNGHEDYASGRQTQQRPYEKHGSPPGCVDKDYDKCDFKVTISKDLNKGRAFFKLSGKVDKHNGGYVAVGLSEDDKMGDDHIVECIKLPTSDTPIHYHSWSRYHHDPDRLKDDIKLIHMTHKKYDAVTGELTCEFDRPLNAPVTHVDIYDNKEKKTHYIDMNGKYNKILMATGGLKTPAINDKLGFHGSKAEGHVYVSNGKTNFYYSSGLSTTKGYPVMSVLVLVNTAMLWQMLRCFNL